MKRLFIVLTVMMLMPITALAEEASAEKVDEETEKILEEGIDTTLDELDLSDLEELYEEDEILGGSLRNAIERIASNGLQELTAQEVFDIIFAELISALKGKIGVVVQMVVMILAMSILNHLQGNFNADGAGRAAFMAGYAVVCMLAINILYTTIRNASDAINQLSGVIEALTPLLTALLTGIGGASGASVMSPFMSALTGTVFVIVEKVIFPGMIVITVLSMISNFSENLDFSGFSELGIKGIKWMLGILFIVFIGLLAIKGIGGAAVDGIYYKTAKYTVEKMVPVVGGMFSDTLDTLMACGVIVQNAVGTVGMVMIAAKLIAPILGIAADIFLFKAAAAIARPMSGKRSAGMLEEASKMAELINVTLLVCSAMAFISIALLMGSAGISFAMR